MKVLILSSTLPSADTEPVPAFVKDQAIAINALRPDIKIDILAPYNAYSSPASFTSREHYDEYRFNYFWPKQFQKLTGRAIVEAINENPFRVLQVPFLFVFEFFTCLRLVRKNKYDLIYAHWFTPQAIVASLVSKITKTPLIFTTHNADVNILKKLKFKPLQDSIIRLVCNQASNYTAVSEQTAKKLTGFNVEGLDHSKKLTILPMGTNPLPVNKSSISKLKTSLDIKKDQKVVLFIGRLVDVKGVDLLIEVMSRVIKDSPNIKLIIAGDGQQRQKLEKLAKKKLPSNSYNFTGYVTGQKKADLINLADVFCIPSIDIDGHSEGLPVAFMEAVMANKIVVASDVTGAQEHVESGHNGFIFPQKDTKKLRQSIIEALGSLDDKDIRSNIGTLAKNFTWGHVANQHIKIMERSIDK